MDGLEEWRAVVGYEGYYEVSSLGNVRSLDREVTQGGTVFRYRGVSLKPSRSRNGYLKVVFSRDNKRQTFSIHRLVALAFIPNPEDLPIVRHLDDLKERNEPDNLAWGTDSDNQADSIRNGSHFWANKSHCPQNHPYDEVNTYTGVNRKGNIVRKCRVCQADRAKATRMRKRGTDATY